MVASYRTCPAKEETLQEEKLNLFMGLDVGDLFESGF